MTNSPRTSPERRWHILRPTKGESVPSRLLVFQIEPTVRPVSERTYEHVFRVGVGVCYWLCDGQVTEQEVTVFRQREGFFKWVSEHSDRQRCTWIYSFGLVYALTLLNAWRTLGGSGEVICSAVLSDPPSIILTRAGRCLRKYIDVANYCRDGLRSLIRATGLTCPSPLSGGYSDADVTNYCTSKTLAVGDYLCRAINLVRTNRLCAWQSTGASLSFATYRHTCLCHNIYLHADLDATRLERDSLYGGRVQKWVSGSVAESVTILDCNSLYPYVMRDYPHPIKLRNHQWGGTVRELRQALSGYWVAATVTTGEVSCDLPRRSGRYLYWDGARSVRHLAGAELQAAVARGSVRKVHALARYDHEFPFNSFVASLFSLKLRYLKEEKHAEASICKLILNSLHGKFAQKGRRWVQSKETPAAGPWATWWGRHPVNRNFVAYRNLGGYSQFLEEAGEWNHSFPGISASISAAARVELARSRNVAGASQTLYCDTDSLHLVGDGPDRMVSADMVDPTSLGKWKVVTTGTDAHYWGLKHYRVGSKYCCCYLTPAAWEVADGRYRDAARIHFGRILHEGLADAVYYREREVKVRDVDSAERMELVDYDEVA